MACNNVGADKKATTLHSSVLVIMTITIAVTLAKNTRYYFGDCPKTQEEMVQYLIDSGFIRSEKVIAAMINVDRANYDGNTTYGDFNMYINYHATISAPSAHGFALEELAQHIKPGNKVLDIGSGSGYLTACMGLMLGDKGLAIGIDHIPELVEFATNNVMRGNPELLTSGRVKFIVGEGRGGVPEEGPYDAIHVGGTMKLIPHCLLNQLKPGGRMLIPVGAFGTPQIMNKVDKELNGSISVYELQPVVFPFLRDREKQWPWNSTDDHAIYQGNKR